MKKFAGLFFLFTLFLLTYSNASAQTVVRVGEQITLADTVQVEFELDVVKPPSTYQVIYVFVDAENSGTIQFSADGRKINDDQYPFPAGSKFPVTIKNGRMNLRAKASGASQTFTILQ